ncbi:DUF799 domain-containing protein [Hydrogenophaga laconesensis]|uniref:Lipoprotein n=1 Tax=Hydrogenophaga laconesensis TaxID=1805971 RepID=A0ABU1V9L7_9BURK|nr:DUF799 domain-containing protein [Hydrogenophaga laconesensis]MDR7093913.1 hypothetical protein [Hydrogenophaga laconesensis]
MTLSLSRLISMTTVAIATLLTGCAAPKAYDYTAFKQARPRSILVLPPVNESVDIKATHSLLSQSSRPLAEAGYYVLPVALVEETFRQNGLTQADDIHAVELKKLNDIFGADAVLYLNVKRYGSTYYVLGSATVVEAQARLVDTRTGTLLWDGKASASSEEGKSNNNGLVGMLITAVVQQVISSVTDQSHEIAGIASQRLLSVQSGKGLLPGPRHPAYADAAP